MKMVKIAIPRAVSFSKKFGISFYSRMNSGWSDNWMGWFWSSWGNVIDSKYFNNSFSRIKL